MAVRVARVEERHAALTLLFRYLPIDDQIRRVGGTLLMLEDGADRRSIRRIAAARLEETRRRIADLRRIEGALAHLLHDCESHAKAPRCPIIAAIEEAA